MGHASGAWVVADDGPEEEVAADGEVDADEEVPPVVFGEFAP